MKCNVITISSTSELFNSELQSEVRNSLENQDIVCIKNVLTHLQCDTLINQASLNKDNGDIISWNNYLTPDAYQRTRLSNSDIPEAAPAACPGRYYSIGYRTDEFFPDLKFYKKFYLELSGIQTDFETPSDYEFSLALNFIKYGPNDFFGKHRHSYKNQKYGMILNLSSYSGDDANLKTGTTVWNESGDFVNTKNIQDVGDLVLFNYGLVHEVDRVISGNRWNVILPNLRKPKK